MLGINWNQPAVPIVREFQNLQCIWLYKAYFIRYGLSSCVLSVHLLMQLPYNSINDPISNQFSVFKHPSFQHLSECKMESIIDCVICKKPLREGNLPLVTLGEKGSSGVNRASVERNDETIVTVPGQQVHKDFTKHCRMCFARISRSPGRWSRHGKNSSY